MGASIGRDVNIRFCNLLLVPDALVLGDGCARQPHLHHAHMRGTMLRCAGGQALGSLKLVDLRST
jgi:hypothetical protein